MNEIQQKLTIGCLLHDFGKLLFRYNDGRNHSISGYEYIKSFPELKDEVEILNCIKYHHSSLLKSANVDINDICYITYIADNIASATDRRSKESSDGGFVRDISSESIFNILNGNNEDFVYKPEVLDEKINYPTKENIIYSESFYSKIVDNIKYALNGIIFNDEYINSLLQILEANLTFVPSSTQTGELRDISLFDHLKLTAAIGLCIKLYLDENNVTDYKNALFNNSTEFYKTKAFRIYSLDISGIQDFIYNISSESALKGLRARSFYLEILMENAIDELLKRLELCRANVLYTGGGHTYIILPSTEKSKAIINDFENELNSWFIDNFGNSLYIAGGYCDCSSDELKNSPQGSYKEIFKNISQDISKKKLNRYTAKDIIKLNSPKNHDHSKECKICHRSDKLNNENECSLCSSLKKLSDMIIEKGDNFFVVTKAKNIEKSVVLPFDCCLTAYKENELKKYMSADSENYIRSYSKNKFFTGNNICSNLWVGDYSSHKEFSQLADSSLGIKRLGVIRADVDNLGQAFVNGFNRNDNNDKYETITRTAVFSRKLSLFFKMHINKILSNGEFQLFKDKKAKARNATIVYAGGDDLFIVGSWDDILCFSVDLYNSLKRFSQNTLTISAGIGIYPEKHPISAMASETGTLEDVSKNYDNESKNAITLFNEENSYHWEELINEVLGEKLNLLQNYILNNSAHAKAILYKFLELIRKRNEENRLNIARFTYLIARLKPDDDKASPEEIANYNEFAKKMFKWIQSEKDSKQLITAIYIYIYMNREENKNG